MNLSEIDATEVGMVQPYLPPDARALIARAESEGINPDILTRTRRWNDPGRQWTPVQTEEWTDDNISTLYDWVSHEQLNLEAEIMRLQCQQNDVTLRLFVHAKQAKLRQFDSLTGGVAPHSEEANGESELEEEWDRFDRRIRLLKHWERLIGPLYFLAVTQATTLPMHDPLLMALRGVCLASPGFNTTNRRGVGAPA